MIAALSWIQNLAIERTIGQGIRHARYVRPANIRDVCRLETGDVVVDAANDKDCEDSGGGDQDSGGGGGGGDGDIEARDTPRAESVGGDRGSKRSVNGDSTVMASALIARRKPRLYPIYIPFTHAFLTSHSRIPATYSVHTTGHAFPYFPRKPHPIYTFSPFTWTCHVFPSFCVHRKQPGGAPSCSGREVPSSVDIPLLPIEALGPLMRDKALRKGGSSCCVLRAVYLEKEVAVKLIYNSRDGYADACREACMYQVGVYKGGEDVMAPILTAFDVPTPRNQLHYLNHPSKVLHRLQGKVIPKLLGVGRHWLGTPFLATSLVRGTSLSALLTYGIPSAVRKAAVLALSRFHKEGVLHGDVTLNNMILESQYDHHKAGTATVVQGSTGGTGTSAGTESGGCGGPKEEPAKAHVVIIDFGRSSIGASREEMDQEMTRLRRILRGS